MVVASSTIYVLALSFSIITIALGVAFWIYAMFTTFDDDINDTEYLSDEIDYKFNHSTEMPDDEAPDYEWLSDILRGK